MSSSFTAAGKFRIDADTRLFGVIGAPVAHSLSPVMHNAALRDMNYPAVYLAFQVTDPAAAAAAMRALGIAGLSVTIPHKVAIMPHLDGLDELARRIGAVNTVVCREDQLIGFNTDCFGTLAALKEKTELAGKRVALLGAGGAARAVGFGLSSEGACITVYNRSEARGRRFAEELQAQFQPLDRFGRQATDIVINTTSLGMFPHTQGSPVHAAALAPGMVVMDIVYNPIETTLLRDARAAGCAIIDGVDMFVYQGARQLELWTGKPAPLATMREAVIAALTARSTT